MVNLLKVPFTAGCSYFVAMSASHWHQFKVPLLYIYYDVPSTGYQDKIISFCAATYAITFLQAARDPEGSSGLTAILSLAAAVAGLSGVNLSSDLRSEIGEVKSTAPYWAQTALIGGLVTALSLLYSSASSNTKDKRRPK
jgi:hypothetical protein